MIFLAALAAVELGLCFGVGLFAGWGWGLLAFVVLIFFTRAFAWRVVT